MPSCLYLEAPKPCKKHVKAYKTHETPCCKHDKRLLGPKGRDEIVVRPTVRLHLVGREHINEVAASDFDIFQAVWHLRLLGWQRPSWPNCLSFLQFYAVSDPFRRSRAAHLGLEVVELHGLIPGLLVDVVHLRPQSQPLLCNCQTWI